MLDHRSHTQHTRRNNSFFLCAIIIVITMIITFFVLLFKCSLAKWILLSFYYFFFFFASVFFWRHNIKPKANEYTPIYVIHKHICAPRSRQYIHTVCKNKCGNSAYSFAVFTQNKKNVSTYTLICGRRQSHFSFMCVHVLFKPSRTSQNISLFTACKSAPNYDKILCVRIHTTIRSQMSSRRNVGPKFHEFQTNARDPI